jgi:hypothetical protein
MEATMRRLLLSLTLALTISAVGASSALAEAPEGAQKALLYGPEPGVPTCEFGGPPTAKTFGFAILNTPGNETTLSGVVSLKGAVPNATYQVRRIQAEPPFGLCGEFVEPPRPSLHTNGSGNGTVEFSGFRIPGARKFYVEVENEAPPFDEYISPTVELD